MKIIIVKDPSLVSLLQAELGKEYIVLVSNSGEKTIESYEV